MFLVSWCIFVQTSHFLEGRRFGIRYDVLEVFDAILRGVLMRLLGRCMTEFLPDFAAVVFLAFGQ